MNKIEKFEDIVAWQKARILTQQIYGCSKVGTFARDFGLRDQVQRASVSTMANIAEGFERGGDKEFIQFLSTAKGSCGEVKSHLYVAMDQSYVSKEQFTGLYQQADEVSRLVAGFMGYLQQSSVRGHKFKRPNEDDFRP
jgi:four helix bundle protein